MSLFRKEAIAHQHEYLTGAITLAQPLSLKLPVFILVTVAISIDESKCFVLQER